MMVVQRQPDRGANAKPRERAWKPKSTTGCITCKVRRVKCDEGKPHCNRCLSTGRRCDGYAPPPQASSSLTTLSASASTISLSHLPSCHQFTSKEEGENFDFFLKYAVKDICGVFNSPFWQHELLQATHYHPAIRHGVIAVGTMHRRYTSGNDKTMADRLLDRQLRFALEQSNKAIQELMQSTKTSPTSETHLKTIMTCCILFITLACLQGEQKEALTHIRCGLRLMKEITSMVRSMSDPFVTFNTHPVTLKSLQQTFLSLIVQALSIMSSADLVHWEIIPAYFLENCPSVSIFWVSLECAQHYFESLLSNVLAFVQRTMEIPAVDDLETPDYAVSGCVFAQLRERFQTGITRLHRTFPEVFSETAEANAVSIRLMCAKIELFFMMLLSAGEEHRGRFDDEGPFEALMDLMTRLEGSRVQYWEYAEGRVRRPVYSSSGPLCTLFMVATRGPNVCLRKKAIRILLNNPRRDGLWDGPWAGRIAQEALTLEENTVREVLGIEIKDQPIPSQFRIRDINISYPVLRQTRVEFRNERAIEMGEPGWVRHFTR